MNEDKKDRILFVDDDANLLAAFQRNLRNRFEFDTAQGGQEGLDRLEKNGPYALLVVDMRMPGMDGVEFLEKSRKHAPNAIRIMLTGNADQQTAVDAVNRGQVYRFLNKPCPPDQLIPVLEQALQLAAMHRIEQELLEGTLMGSVHVMAEVLGLVAPNALGHGQRLRDAMHDFVKFTGVSPAWEFDVAALLADLGAVSLPPRVWRKIAESIDLLPGEQQLVDRVPRLGHDLLVDIPRLKGVADAVLYQNQNYDGTGSQIDGRAGEQIPLAARFLRILKDRITLEGEGIVKAKARAIMERRPGAYDPKYLALSFECFPGYLTQVISASHPVRTLRVTELEPGQIVVSDIRSPDGMILLTAGHELTPMMLQRLKNHAQIGLVREPLYVQDPPEGPDPAASPVEDAPPASPSVAA